MSKVRAFIIGIFIWILGAGFYTASSFISILSDPELQANIVLAVAVIPNAWLGVKLFYKRGINLHWLKLTAIVLPTAILLDVLITVPYFIVPQGGSWRSFFGATAFWLIAMEYALVIYIYWCNRIKPHAGFIMP